MADPAQAPIPVFPFGGDAAPFAVDREKLGNKGAGLVEMANLGLPVPPGFIIGTETGRAVFRKGEDFRQQLARAVREALETLAAQSGRTFGGSERPFLVSVRSGATISMPGMMDTVLNVGLNLETTAALAEETGDAAFAWETYLRFIHSYASVVLEIEATVLDGVMEEAREALGLAPDEPAAPDQLAGLIDSVLQRIREISGSDFPQSVDDQLERALVAVFQSWNSDRARNFRKLADISGIGTAAIVQAMVFGNRGEHSCTGVYSTRNPSSGERAPWGEYLPRAQGEDVVGGAHTGFDISEAAREASFSDHPSMETEFPEAYGELVRLGEKLEAHFGEVQEIEFTVEEGQLYLLQTRSAKLAPAAAMRCAIAMADEGLIDRQTALSRVPADITDAFIVPQIAPGADRPLARGLAASPGVASGPVVFDSEQAVLSAEAGTPAILFRTTTDPRDVHGMSASAGIVTSRGGLTSHAAVVARSMRRPCITAAMKLQIDEQAGNCAVDGKTIAAGDIVTIDGRTGFIYAGEQPVVQPEPTGDVATIVAWRKEAGTGG